MSTAKSILADLLIPEDPMILQTMEFQFLNKQLELHGRTIHSYLSSIEQRILYLERDGVCG